jgi:hypothetical protein
MGQALEEFLRKNLSHRRAIPTRHSKVAPQEGHFVWNGEGWRRRKQCGERTILRQTHMNWKKEWKPLALVVAVFLVCFYLPMESLPLRGAVPEGLYLVRWYASEHVLLCLVPAFFIAGAIAVFISQASVMKYLGARANKALAYGVASVSGSVLAVCSCTVLPLFAGIYRMGAGLGPATAFLFRGLRSMCWRSS